MKKNYVISLCLIIFCCSFFSISFLNVSFVKIHQPPKQSSRSGAMEALDFWSRARAYPELDVPADKYFKAYQYDKAKFKRSDRQTNAAGIFEPLGPLDLQGRSLSVAVNPQNSNTIYLGSASGGLWRSNTMGLEHDWWQVPLGHPALGISSIVIDPLDTNVMYLGTGEVYRYQGSFGGITIRTTRGSVGIGILKTTDGGATWTKSLDWSSNQQRGIQKVILNPKNHNSVWAGTTEGIYFSSDAGATWNLNLNLPYTLVNDLLIHSNDTNKMIASVGNFKTTGFGVYRSTDGGASWNKLSGIPDFSGKTLLGMYESNPDIIYASVADSTTGVGQLMKSTNFGTTWTSLPTNVYWGVQGWYSHYIAVHPTNPNLLFHAAVGTVYSADGGSSFFGTNGGYSDNHGFAYDPNNPDVLYTANDDGIYRSTDFGATFTDIGFGMMTGQFYCGFSNSSQDSLLAIGQSQDHIPGYIYRGSMNWDRSVVDEAGWTAIHPTNDNIMYADSRFGNGIYRSTNRGNTFNYIAAPSGFGSWNAPLMLAPSTPTTLYFAKDKVYKSTNSGSAWTATNSNTVLDGNPAVSMAISFTDPNVVYVGNAPIFSRANIWRTNNGGTSWTGVGTTLPDRYPLDLAVSTTNSDIVYVALGGFGAGRLYKSTNAGTNWTDITGTLPDVPTTAVVVDPLNTNNVYVGNDIGVYLSTDAGTTWSTFSDGLPDAVIVADLVISPSNRALRCVTHGNGVFERKMYDGTPVPAFDYKAYQLVTPSDNSIITIGSTLSNFKASFRSNSGVAQTDSFEVQYRIVSSLNEVFSSTQKIKGMKVGEVRIINFDGSYTPPDTGIYTIQAITLASDLNSSNDTLTGTLTVSTTPTLPYFSYSKNYCPYTEISGGTPGPYGDDAQKAFALPFPFTYDGYTYDTLQISTNGWAEFGKGAAGTERGHSSSGQLGFYYNSNTILGTTERPNKVLGLWWDDMHSGDASPGGNISYKTEGTAPNRVLVVQWKNVKAHYEDGITTLLNFQLRLFETSNIIEFHYGPVVLGLTYGAAAIGIKDHRGGDYHYYDLYRMNTGTESEVVTSLNAQTDWPGQDSCFRIVQNAKSVQVEINGGWELVSCPVIHSDYSVKSIYPTGQQGTLNRFLSGIGYIRTDSLYPGQGAWLKFPSSMKTYIVGNEMPTLEITLTQDWNLIGSVDHEVPPPSDPNIGQLFGYDNGYTIATSVIPGKGYWVKANSAGTITLGDVQKKEKSVADVNSFPSITIQDNKSGQQKLFIAPKEEVLSLNKYEMPPLPPTGMFDARFISNRIIEQISSEKENVFPIRVSSANYPLTISFDDVAGGMNAKIRVGEKEFPLKQGTPVKIMKEGEELALVVEQTGTLPNEFALYQNYPNPFNPSTVISYQLKVKSSVSLKVYDVLGKEVATLVNEIQDGGVKSVKFDGSALASGVYLYKLKAGDFSEVKKFVLIK
ncbi:MAG: T9SS type A sorting domain-containing protein [Ignavibacteriae bacterium]|nr:T9SS type A sorting domain-containing protein [Ignavibacteriota bacterium]